MHDVRKSNEKYILKSENPPIVFAFSQTDLYRFSFNFYFSIISEDGDSVVRFVHHTYVCWNEVIISIFKLS